MTDEQIQTLEDLALYHECISARAKKEQKMELRSELERLASAGAAAMHGQWAEGCRALIAQQEGRSEKSEVRSAA